MPFMLILSLNFGCVSVLYSYQPESGDMTVKCIFILGEEPMGVGELFDAFEASKPDMASLLGGADIAMLMVEDSNVGGAAYVTYKKPLGFSIKNGAASHLIFAHEVEL